MFHKNVTVSWTDYSKRTRSMFWKLLTKILVDLLVGLIVELALAAIMSCFFQGRQDRSVSLA